MSFKNWIAYLGNPKASLDFCTSFFLALVESFEASVRSCKASFAVQMQESSRNWFQNAASVSFLKLCTGNLTALARLQLSSVAV